MLIPKREVKYKEIYNMRIEIKEDYEGYMFVFNQFVVPQWLTIWDVKTLRDKCDEVIRDYENN